MGEFIRPSPLRQWLGEALARRSAASGLRVDHWIRYPNGEPVCCGDHVHAIDDPRHGGRVVAIFDGITVRVQWTDNGWKTDYAIADLVKLKAGE